MAESPYSPPETPPGEVSRPGEPLRSGELVAALPAGPGPAEPGPAEPGPAEPRLAEPRLGSTETRSNDLTIDVILPLMLLIGGVAVWLILGSAEPETRPASDNTREGRLRALPPVRVERLRSLESTGQQLHLVVDGTVVPFREARVAAEVAGRIVFKSEKCEAGTYVKKNDLLMKIDATDYELEVQRLQRMQEQEYQSLAEADQEMINTQRLIDVAKQDVELQQKEVDRQNSLRQGFTSRAEIDQAQRSLLAARQQMVNVENQLSLLKKRRVRLEASEKLAAVQLKLANVNLARTDILAPIDGVIVSEDADLNTFVARGAGLVTIDDTSKVDVATSLRMDQLYWILDQRGERVDESSRGYDLPETPAIIEYELAGREGVSYRWNGRLLSYDGIGLDPVTRTVPVRVVVDHPTEYVDEQGEVSEVTGATALVRGMYVRVNLIIQPQSPLVVIPATALQPGNRVLQFVSDESVLDRKPDKETEKTPDSGNADKQAAAKSSDDKAAKPESSFDASQWEPGRVFVRRRVNPVDSLRVGRISAPTPSAENEDDSERERFWVCEVRDAHLASDSLVVVSPLGSFSEVNMPVRASRKGLSEDPQEVETPQDIGSRQSESQQRESTAVSKTNDGEDA